MLLKSTDFATSKARHPSLLPRCETFFSFSLFWFLEHSIRPSSRCFLFEMEHIKLVCFSDKCLILNPDDKATQNFIYGLKMQFHCVVRSHSHVASAIIFFCQESLPVHEESLRLNTDSSMRLLYQKSVQVSFSFAKTRNFGVFCTKMKKLIIFPGGISP